MHDRTLTDAGAYRLMRTIRRFEERSLELSRDGMIAGSIHLCLGQEAVPVGALAALADGDRVLTTYRGHGWAVAAGVPLEGLLGELCHRADGINGGRGGSAHFSAPRWGLLGENSIVGAGVPIAAGVALAERSAGTGGVVLASIGDGAMNQGAVHEALVFAAARDLPLIVLVENNEWAEMTPSATMLRIDRLADRAGGYGIPGHVVDGTDPFAVRDVVAEAATAARGGGGPVLIEALVPRLGGHYNRDIEHYRSAEDRAAVALRDPLALLRRRLLDDGELTGAAIGELDAHADEAVDAATKAVRDMPSADPAAALDHLYGAGPTSVPTPTGEPESESVELSYVLAVNAALRDELAARPEVVVYGEDVGAAGGIFGATRKLQKEFGAGRVFDTPIVESAILGSAVGAAMAGLRPVVEIMWADFMLVALDQLVNQAANVRYVSRSELSAPLVVRMQQGVTPGSCAQHSQNLEALLAHVPGLRVGLPTTPGDAYAMLRSAVADPDPVVVIESRSLYLTKGMVRRGGPVEPVGGAAVRRTGGDVALVGWGPILPHVLAAADDLAAAGIEASVVDLRWLNPLDLDTVERVVRASGGRILVVHEANVTGGFGAELAARLHERLFGVLDRPVARLGAPDTRIPAAPALQEALLPGAAAIVRAATALVEGSRE
ncbi:MAG TPA: thiamine pyrophosphate-dependent enzyme [Jiangellaceae bacterium]